jgi:hypothetical protein
LAGADRAATSESVPNHVEPDESRAVFDRFKLWKDYEGVAMHFNDLIIKLRTQSLGGVAAFAALAAVVAKGDTPADLRWGILTGAFFLLILFWSAVWILDLGYYNRLLQGAVDALLTIESSSVGSPLVDRIELSSRIEQRVTSGKRVDGKGWRVAFYVVVLLALLIGLAVSGYRFWCVERSSSQKPRSSQVTAEPTRTQSAPSKEEERKPTNQR